MTTPSVLSLPRLCGDEPVPASGWYLCKLHLGQKPVVIFNTAGSTEWRDVLRIVQVDAFAGPLPEGLRPEPPVERGSN